MLASALVALVACGSDTEEYRDVGRSGVDEQVVLPRFSGAELRRGVDVPVEGDGVVSTTLWSFDAHPGTSYSTTAIPEEQDVYAPVPTEVDDAAVVVRNGAYCYVVPVITAVESSPGVVEASLEELERDPELPCPEAEEIVVITFDLSASVGSFNFEGVDVPLGS